MSLTRPVPYTSSDLLGPDDEGIYKRLGRIGDTRLGYEDHGIFTAYVGFDFGGSGQGIPGGVLDTVVWVHDETGEEVRGDRPGLGHWSSYREGTAFGHDYIIAILQAVGVEKWEDLKGRLAYALYDSDGYSAMIIGIETDPTKKNPKRVVFKDLARKHGLLKEEAE